MGEVGVTCCLGWKVISCVSLVLCLFGPVSLWSLLFGPFSLVPSFSKHSFLPGRSYVWAAIFLSPHCQVCACVCVLGSHPGARFRAEESSAATGHPLCPGGAPTAAAAAGARLEQRQTQDHPSAGGANQQPTSHWSLGEGVWHGRVWSVGGHGIDDGFLLVVWVWRWVDGCGVGRG